MIVRKRIFMAVCHECGQWFKSFLDPGCQIDFAGVGSVAMCAKCTEELIQKLVAFRLGVTS